MRVDIASDEIATLNTDNVISCIEYAVDAYEREVMNGLYSRRRSEYQPIEGITVTIS